MTEKNITQLQFLFDKYLQLLKSLKQDKPITTEIKQSILNNFKNLENKSDTIVSQFFDSPLTILKNNTLLQADPYELFADLESIILHNLKQPDCIDKEFIRKLVLKIFNTNYWKDCLWIDTSKWHMVKRLLESKISPHEIPNYFDKEIEILNIYYDQQILNNIKGSHKTK